jgi:proline iminopeptidase
MKGGAMRAVAVLAFLPILAATAVAGPAAPSGPGATLTNGGVKIWYEVRGQTSGRPLIMVNGGPGFDHTYVLCSDAWDAIARTRRVVFYDQRGNGRSGALRKGQSCTLGDQIADLDALRARIGADRVDLLGHSWGGYLVMAYAWKHPEHVAHLIITDSAAPKWSDTEFMFKSVFPEGVERQERFDFADAMGDTTANAASLHEYLQWLFVSTEKRDEFMSHAWSYKYTRSVNEALNADLAKYDMWPVLPTFKMPTLVITGRWDMNVAPSTAWKIHKAIPGSRWEAFEHSGHLPYFEEPDKFVRVVNDFLGAP